MARSATPRRPDPGLARLRLPVPGEAPRGRPVGRRRRVGRVLAAVLSAAVLLASGAGWAASQRYLGKIQQISVFDGLADRPAAAGSAMTVLLVASDDRSGLSRQQRNRLNLGHQDYGRHTDTIILMHLSGDGDRVTLVSIPRDSLVTLPAWTDADGTRHQPAPAKINAAFSYGGPALTVATVEQATGVRIDHYLEVSFSGFLTMVNALGGVEVCLRSPARDPKAGLDLPAGRQVVTGPQALAYVRTRSLDGTADIGRIQRQQKFLAAMMQKATSTGVLLNPITFDRFVSAAMESLTADEGLGQSEMIDIAQQVRDLDPRRVTFRTVPVAEYDHRVSGLGSTLLWDQARAAALFAALRDDRSIDEPQTATVQVPPSQVRVQVLNGAGVAGLAGRAADDLARAGFVLDGPAGNAERSGAQATVIRYDPRWDVSLKTLQAALPGAQAEPVEGLGRVFEVIVGTSYAGVSPVKVAASGSTGDRVRSAAEDICS